MRSHFHTLFFLAASLFVASPCLAQPGRTGRPRQSDAAAMVTYVGHNGNIPQPILAPGELITLIVHGVGANLTSNVLADSEPLPTELAGISIQMVQLGPFPKVDVPIYSVIPLPACNWDNRIPPDPACGMIAGITIQVPFELDTLPREIRNPALIIFENGTFASKLAV